MLNLVHGYGKEAGEPLVAHPDVRAISFTGSTATGNRIVQASAGLKKFSMELGGKSPFVIFDDADLDRALDAAVFMIFSNNGERCTAGCRILVQQSIYADFAREVRRARQAHHGRRPAGREDHRRPDDLAGPSGQGAQLHRARPEGRRDAAVRRAGRARLPDRVKKGNYVLPTVFADVDNRMKIAQDEIFGPVACLIPFKDEADAIRLANDIQYGLSSYVWTENIGRAHRVAAAVEAGMCFVNSQNVRDLRQPFGGTKASGTGREGGTWSYEVFCEPKNVAVSLGSASHSALGSHDHADTKLIAAVAQTATVLLDTPATVERALALMAEAAKRGAQLLVFPEAFIGGYPKGADFHIYLGARTPQGRAEFKRYFDAAITARRPRDRKARRSRRTAQACTS